MFATKHLKELVKKGRGTVEVPFKGHSTSDDYATESCSQHPDLQSCLFYMIIAAHPGCKAPWALVSIQEVIGQREHQFLDLYNAPSKLWSMGENVKLDAAKNKD